MNRNEQIALINAYEQAKMLGMTKQEFIDSYCKEK